MTIAYIGLGSNEGDRLANLSAAVAAIGDIPETRVERVSHAYESEAAFLEAQPAFANAVARIDTELRSDQLLDFLGEIEESLGRVRTQPNGPRTIDLDVLLFGDEETNSERLTVPHPGLLQREFVVVPLLDIAPRLHLPDGTPVTREAATEGPIIGDLGAIPGVEIVTDWVEVAHCDAGADIVTGWDAAISLQREVLQDAGIPYAFDPYEPNATIDPWGMPRTFRLLVPASHAEQANALIAEAMAAEPEFPEDIEPPDTDDDADESDSLEL